MTLSQFIELVIFVGGILSVWINTQLKLKELEVRVVALENQKTDLKEDYEKLSNKLDVIFSKLEKINVALMNKVDRP